MSLSNVLEKLIYKQEVTDADVRVDLGNICDDVHHECSSLCPVYAANGNDQVDKHASEYGCVCFKNGEKMLHFLRGETI